MNSALQHALASSEIATTILRFLLHACSVLVHDFTEEAFAVFSGLCEKFALSFCDQKLWKAYALVLMALAVRLPNYASENLTRIRALNARMQVTETVLLRASMFHGLPPECSDLVDIGLALQVSVEAERLDKQIKLWDVLKLATNLLKIFLFQPPFSSCIDYLRRSLHLIGEALEKCDAAECESLDCEIFSILMHVAELKKGVIPDELSSSAEFLFIDLLKLLPFKGVIDVFARIIPRKATSAHFCLLLALMGEFVKLKWPNAADDASFKKLRDVLGWMFTSGALRFNPTDTKEEDEKQARDFVEQVETVLEGVKLYLMVIWLEVNGGTDYSGFMSAEHRQKVSESWLRPLLEQQVVITDSEFEYHISDARLTLDYALYLNEDPQYVVDGGLP